MSNKSKLYQYASKGNWSSQADKGEVLHGIENLQSEVEELKTRLPEWISVQDDLPDLDKPCLVYFGEPDIQSEIDYMDIEVDYGTHFWANHGDDVTHWMYLPEPPFDTVTG